MTLHNKLAFLAAALALSAPAAHAQDVAAGKTVYAQCAACHSIDGANGAGPSLKGVVGRKAGSYDGFRYSRAMKNANVTWDAKTLDAYLANPQSSVPGTTMPFAGIADAKQRAALVQYLGTLK